MQQNMRSLDNEFGAPAETPTPTSGALPINLVSIYDKFIFLHLGCTCVYYYREVDISVLLKARFIFKMKHLVEQAMRIGCENVVNKA